MAADGYQHCWKREHTATATIYYLDCGHTVTKTLAQQLVAGPTAPTGFYNTKHRDKSGNLDNK